MHNNPRNYYSSKISSLESVLKEKKKRNSYLYLLRFITFISIVVFVFLFFKSQNNFVFLFSGGIFLIAFIAALSFDLKNSWQIKFTGHKLSINKSELRFLDHQYTERKTGEEYMELNPHLADDFDIFGTGSVFQYLNRTSTLIGEARFASWLCEPQTSVSHILAKQNAIEELSAKADFIQEFMAQGMFVNENGSETDSLMVWLEESPVKIKTLKFLTYLIPVFTLSWLTIVILGYMSVNSLLVPILTSLYIIFLNRKILASAHNKLGNTAKTFEKYTDLIRLIENEKFTSDYLSDLQKNLISDGIKASHSLKDLYKLLHRFDVRFNVLVSFLLNSFLIYDIRIYVRLAGWKTRHKNLIPGWFESLAELDSLISFSVFTFNNADSLCRPVIENTEFTFRATEMGHPIIAKETRVCNSLHFSGTPSVIIITGANMAGKSTFLRTVSINMILAMNGAPVCAKEFVFTPCSVLSSIKIQDSLYKNESYFYAELLRIKEIIEHTREQSRTLVVLDEILRGTNTKDKQTGSLGILEKLISQNAVVLLATHDLVIGELENKYPEFVRNYCFEVELTNDQLIFDYKLKKGISKKLNASFLMKKLNIID